MREFALYGETTGETDEFGLPVRYNWAAEYRGKAMVVYGHTPVPEAEWLNNTICIDTGCVFGGKLTALRYPERELVSVPAKRMYYEPIRPLQPPQAATLTAQQRHDDLLDLDDVLGKRIIETRLRRTVTIREENAIAALEVMSRFAANPKWLIYLPPTMSPSETSRAAGLLEHPDEAFDYYRSNGVERVVCEEKHMGSRAVVVVCRTKRPRATRFGVEDEGRGIVYTRTGRRFFDDDELEAALLAKLRERRSTPRMCGTSSQTRLVLPRLRADAVVGQGPGPAAHAVRAGRRGGDRGSRSCDAPRWSALTRAACRWTELAGALPRARRRDASATSRPTAATAGRCAARRPSLAPFHLLASEGAVHTDKDHVWHMETLHRALRRRIQRCWSPRRIASSKLADADAMRRRRRCGGRS